MLDIRYVRENPEKVEQNALNKGYKINVKQILELDESRRTLNARVDELRTRRNEIASAMKGGKPSNDLVAEGKRIKNELAELEEGLRDADETFFREFKKLPNMALDSVPVGSDRKSVV